MSDNQWTKTCRMSDSPIWSLQKTYYQNLGIDTWSKAMVPFSATTNCFVAYGYAQTIQAYINDLKLNGQWSGPVYIVELGTGHGRFSFMLIKALIEMFSHGSSQADLSDMPFRYIMTDISPVSIKAWEQHDALSEWIAAGILDFALFDATELQDVTLTVSGDSFEENTDRKNNIVIANFVLDVLPYDAFYFGKNTLSECQVALNYHDKEGLIDESGDVFISDLESLVVDEQLKPCAEDYYNDDIYNELLNYYRKNTEDSLIQIPVCTIRVIEYFRMLSKHCLWLIAEEAATELEHLQGKKSSGIKTQGSFTARVNLHAVKHTLPEYQGQFLAPTVPDPRFDCYSILSSDRAHLFSQTSHCWTQMQSVFGPGRFFRLFVALRRNKTRLSDDAALAVLEMCRYDPYIVWRLRYRFLEACRSARKFQRKALINGLCQVWDNYYNIGESYQYALYTGRMMLEMNSLDKAEFFLSISLNTEPDSLDETYYFIGLTYYKKGDKARARKAFSESLARSSQYKNKIEALDK